MRPQNRRRALAATLLMASAAFGCTIDTETDGDIVRVAVSGQVTLDGKPLPEGKIEFAPVGTAPADIAVADIEDGQFSIIRSVGPSPGKYRVRISSRKSQKIAAGQEPGGAPNKREPEKIPKKYNAKSELEIDIPADGSVTLDFPLENRP
jgi:hypothetical protein